MEEIILQAVIQNGHALEYASNRLQDNVLFEDVKKYGNALPLATKRLVEAIRQNGDALKYAPESVKDNGELVLETVKQNWHRLEHASKRLQDDEEIVLEAVKQNGRALQYASDRLRNDFNFAKEIFKYCNTLEIFQYFGDELRNIEFICYFIENYQSRFHELKRKKEVKNRDE